MSVIGAVYARELLRQLGLTGPFDIRDAAHRLGLDVEEADADEFEGALVRVKNAPFAIIAINKSIPEIGRKNFTIAHEIAHFVIPHHGQVGAVCKKDEVENWSRRVSPDEEEANQFAGEFIIPTSFVEEKVCATPPSFDHIRWMAETFMASLTASGYRLMELTSFNAVLVWSTDGLIKWFKPSAGLDWFIPVRDEVARGTCAYDLFQGRTVPDRPEKVPARFWIKARGLRADAAIFEHSLFLRRYRSVLTLLYSDEAIADDEDEESKEGLEPREFTLNRKRWPR